MQFEKAVLIILKHEGGYVHDPDDPGGETKFGISKRAYPNLDIAGLDREQASEIYRTDYWNKMKCGRMPTGIDLAVFDAAVNQGAGFASKAIQRAAGAAPDGIIGPMTLTAIRDGVRKDILIDFMTERAERYAGLNRKYWKGWYRRLFDVHQHAVKEMEYDV